ncbi:hypothetical protein GBA52_025229 [Prunus armeniaca]|nr:hypothetical protein GBA52_025229 [Prunus armeniaca]
MSGHVSAEQLSMYCIEQRAILENEMLRRQDEELRCLFPQTDRAVPSYLEYYPVEKEKSLVNHGFTNPDLVNNFAFENGDSDITLHLGRDSVPSFATTAFSQDLTGLPSYRFT